MSYQMNLLPEQKEKARHGETLFPIQKYVTTLSSDYPAVKPHWHEEAEFTLITKGKCTYQIHLNSYTVQTGDLVFITPMHLHSITGQTDSLPSDDVLSNSMQSDTYVFHMHFLGAISGDVCAIQYLTPLMTQKLLPPFIIGKSHPAYSKALQLFYQIDDAWKKKEPGFELLIKAYLLSVIALLLPYCIESSSLPQRQTEHTQKIKTALEYIAAHYTEPITIADVASACYFSEYHFMRFFRKYVGMSCMDYIKNLKLEKAVELLKDGQYSILDVSLASGFHNLSYFYREFKNKYGMTPKEFIRKTTMVK